ncbi:hypothetical protein SapgrDRAFT_0105 [Saprospira grandis DSM 2844]|uniref:Uncharacterized protein n=1 Tax=Saprospira grandis DSM 2844 TaxID=694433 RepID=J0NWI3_9BACT|nr:hypothetical protein [Saprospira grandis]EJF51864.1 hypothetical protein SapgrDRAFT_0105 [Saprospira grandis DSM 2844]
MKKQSVFRAYNYSDAQLFEQAMELLIQLKEDQKEFAQYGILSGHIAAFEQLVKDFSDIPTDEELMGEQMVATEKKQDAATEVRRLIRGIMNRVGQKYHSKSGRYRKFGTSKLSDMSDPKLYLCAKRVIRVGQQSLAHLEDVGLNQPQLDELHRANQAFELALHIKADRVSDRDISVENRVILGNRLYEQMLKMGQVGKDIWQGVNTAKYERYCTYESSFIREEKRQSQKED